MIGKARFDWFMRLHSLCTLAYFKMIVCAMFLFFSLCVDSAEVDAGKCFE
jgi:hypothetical protein